jgi:hypothetical protein
MLAGVTDISATGVGSWNALGGHGVELRLRGMQQQQKREDARTQVAKGHDGQACGKDVASISSTLLCPIEMSGFRARS